MRTSLFNWGIIYDPQSGKRIKSNIPIEVSSKDKLNGSYEQVTCGLNYSLVLHSTGRVFVVGDESKHGRLGLGDETTIAERLTPISGNLPAICYIYSGPSTSILLSNNRTELWAFGKGIGGSPKRIYSSEQQLTHCACNENSIVVVIDACRIEERHFNRNGFTDQWKPVYQMTNDRIKQIDLGSSLNGFISEQGHIFLWGSQVPRGKNLTEEQFVEISISQPLQKDLNDDRPVQLSCSRGQFHSHALLLTEQGSIYSIGSNYKEKLGINEDIAFTDQWTLIKMENPCQFRMVAAGGIHSSALSIDGQIYTWGCGSDGRLGHPEAAGHRYLYKEKEPRPIQSLIRYQSTQIGTSYYHMAAIVSQ